MSFGKGLHTIGFVHIGLAKSGSTYLQKALFPSQNHYFMVGSHGKDADLNNHFERIWREETGQGDLEAWCHNWSLEFVDLLTRSGLNSSEIAVSNERLAGHFITGYGRYAVADKLRFLFGETRIVIVLRDPVAYIQSAYNQMIKQGVSQPLSYVLQDKINFPGRHFRQRLDYMNLVRYYCQLFSEQRVLALPMEMMASEEESFTQHLSSFLEIPELGARQSHDEPELENPYQLKNPSFSGFALSFQRFSNYLGLPRLKSRRFLARLDRKILMPILPRIGLRKKPTINKCLTLVSDLLKGVDYNCWSGELERFNYQIPPKKVGESSPRRS